MSGSSMALTGKEPKWQHQLSSSTSSFVNWVAISNDASRIIADTYYYPYPGTTSNDTHGMFGAYCFDSAGKLLWADDFEGDEGVFSVAISGDGRVAAAGGLFTGGAYSDRPDSGLLRAYDASNGKRLLDYPGRRRINYIALSDDGAVLAAVSASKLYVFVRKNGSFAVDPAIPVGGGGFLDCVAVHPSGQWVVACDRGGNVYLVTIVKGTVQQTYKWTAPERMPFLSVAISKDNESFVVGGGNAVYLFTRGSMMKAIPSPIAQFTPGSVALNTRQDVRWVAISGDGGFVTSAENQQQTGLLRGLSYRDGQLSETWNHALNRNPNSTSMDSEARYVTVADGNPVGTHGNFYLLDGASGRELWRFETTNMSWPMFINSYGSGIAAGSDTGDLYFFEP
jgi:outer membrane protein assembly factor BamB